jgi:hypothetical protein
MSFVSVRLTDEAHAHGFAVALPQDVRRGRADGHSAEHRETSPADLRARSGLTTEQLIYVGRAAGWLEVPGLE